MIGTKMNRYRKQIHIGRTDNYQRPISLDIMLIRINIKVVLLSTTHENSVLINDLPTQWAQLRFFLLFLLNSKVKFRIKAGFLTLPVLVILGLWPIFNCRNLIYKVASVDKIPASWLTERRGLEYTIVASLMKINYWPKPHHSKGLISLESSEPLCWLHLHNVSTCVSVFSPHQGWAYSRQNWASSWCCGWRSSGPPSLRTPPAGWGSWRWPTGSFWDYERPTLESERAEQPSVSALVSTVTLSLNSLKGI